MAKISKKDNNEKLYNKIRDLIKMGYTTGEIANGLKITKAQVVRFKETGHF